MTASCLSTPLALDRPFGGLGSRPRIRGHQLVLPAVFSLVMAAALLAPEQPRAQADICERHNGVAACRIW